MTAIVSSFESTDASSAEETWNRYFPGAVVGAVGRVGYRLRWDSVEIDGVLLYEADLTSAGHVVADPSDSLQVGHLVGSGLRHQSGRDRLGTGGAVLYREDQHVALTWDTLRARQAAFDRPAAQDLARTLTGDDLLILRATGTEALTEALGAHWLRQRDHTQRMLIAMHPASAPILEAELRRSLLVATLACFPTTFHAGVGVGQLRAAPATVRRALDYIDARAADPIGIDDIARAARMSVRGLQRAFQRELDTTPLARLREVRMRRAHDELIRTDPVTGDPVAVIARRWGFGHLSRFASAHRAEFGEYPHETRRR